MAQQRPITETAMTWREATDRQRELKDAGYHSMAVDMGEQITIIIDGGPRDLDLARIPPRR